MNIKNIATYIAPHVQQTSLAWITNITCIDLKLLSIICFFLNSLWIRQLKVLRTFIKKWQNYWNMKEMCQTNGKFMQILGFFKFEPSNLQTNNPHYFQQIYKQTPLLQNPEKISTSILSTLPTNHQTSSFSTNHQTPSNKYYITKYIIINWGAS